MSMKPKIILQLVHLICLVVFAAAGKNECVVTRCKHNGPIIRFPFRLKEQPEHCGYPGFQLYCHSYDKRTMLEFQYESKTSLRGLYLSFSVNASVRSIDYKNRLMKVDVDTKLQLQQQLLNPQSSTPFRPQLVREEIDVAADLYGYKLKYTEFTFLNCSTKNFDDIMVNKIDDFRGVYAISSRIKTFQAPLKSCTKMFNISLVPYSFLLNYWLYDPPIITWTTPDCGHCEAKRQYCRLRNNSSSYTTTKRNESTTICFPKGTYLHNHFSAPPVMVIRISTISDTIHKHVLQGEFIIILYLTLLNRKIQHYLDSRCDKYPILCVSYYIVQNCGIL